MNILSRLEKTASFWFLLITSGIFFLLRLPSLFEPYWYGDEGIYQTIGLSLQKGALLYKETWDNKPPLLYVLYGLFGGDQFSLRLLSLVAGLVSIALLFFLAKKIFTNKKLPYLSTALFAFLLGTPLVEGNIANAENFMMVLILLSANIVFSKQILPNTKSLFLAGIFSALAFLFKVVGIFDFGAFAIFLFIINYQNIKSIFFIPLQLIPFGIGFGAPIVVTFVYFFLTGSVVEFYQGAFTNMVGYVGYGNNFIIPQGLLILKLLALFSVILIVFIQRKRIPQGIIFLVIWISFSVFNTFFAGRPYIHYLLVLLPSFCLLTPYAFAQKKAGLVLWLGIILLIFSTFSLYNRPFTYYTNFFKFTMGIESVTQYFDFFDKNTKRDYQLAEFIRHNTKASDAIFIWGNNAQVYKMTGKIPPGRFTVAYHMSANQKSLEETYTALTKQQPKYIIVTSQNNPIPYPLNGYSHRVTIEDSLVYEKNY